jgi:cysteine synthase
VPWSVINVAGAIALAKQLGRGKRIATILCDTGFRYLSTLYNPEWMVAKGLPPMPWQLDN